MDDVKKAALPAAIGGRRMLGRGAGGQRTLEDFKADNPFQDSKRRVPNGPDPIHNRYFDLQITALQAWFWCLSWSFFPLVMPLQKSSCYLCTNAQGSLNSTFYIGLENGSCRVSLLLLYPSSNLK